MKNESMTNDLLRESIARENSKSDPMRELLDEMLDQHGYRRSLLQLMRALGSDNGKVITVGEVKRIAIEIFDSYKPETKTPK